MVWSGNEILVESKRRPKSMGINVGAFVLELEETYDCKTVKQMAESGDFRRNCVRLTVMQKRSETKGSGSELFGVDKRCSYSFKTRQRTAESDDFRQNLAKSKIGVCDVKAVGNAVGNGGKWMRSARTRKGRFL
jgi:hypothetical protein